MTIQQFIDRASVIALNHKDVKSTYVGNTFDMSTSKGDTYPNVWFEFPILTAYTLKNKKTYTFSFNVLGLPALDNPNSEMEVISAMEQIADDLLWAFGSVIPFMGIVSMNGLTLRNVNPDYACGIRIDFTLETARFESSNGTCDPKTNFKTPMSK